LTSTEITRLHALDPEFFKKICSKNKAERDTAIAEIVKTNKDFPKEKIQNINIRRQEIIQHVIETTK
jgi:hypothetical protein